MKKTKEEIVRYINTLKGYEGYVQFSHRPIDRERDIFYDNKEVKIEDEKGFIYEAHFYNGKESIAIKQVNSSWFVSTTALSNLKEEDTQSYISDIESFNYNIKMAQIWEEKADKLCAGMKVMKLQKVVFMGFENG